MIESNNIEKPIIKNKEYREKLNELGFTVKDLRWRPIELLDYQPFPHNKKMIEMIFAFTFNDSQKGYEILAYLYNTFMDYFKDLAPNFNIEESYVKRAYYYYNSSIQEFEIVIRLPLETHEKFLESVHRFLVEKLYEIVTHLYRHDKNL